MSSPRENRVMWVITTIRAYGYMEPAHVAKRFGMPERVGDLIIQEAMKAQPRITWNKASRRYEYEELK